MMYTDLFSKLQELKARTARFRRVALHLHSPDSQDWPRRGADHARNDPARFAAATGPSDFAAELRPYLDLVAVTDHMRCDFATRVSMSVRNNDEFLVLPGMEVNFRPEAALAFARIHLLVIFSEGSPKESFERLFAGLSGIPANDATRTASHEVAGIPLKEWVKRVHKEGGICIAAHVDNTQGVRRLFRQTSRETLALFSAGEPRELEQQNEVGDALKNYLFESGLDAVEIVRASDGPHYRWICQVDGKVRWIPTTLTFDAHCVEEFGKQDRITYVKMTWLGLAGLKSAFEFPDTRIRFPGNVPTVPTPTLLGIQIVGGEESFFKDVTLALTENLNCLIGARGSGKSTIVEALRYLFGHNRTLGELEKLETTIRDMQRANLNGSLIRAVYRTSTGEERVVEATYDEKSDYGAKVYTKDGEFINVADVEACGDYPLRLFGWSEVETLGRSPARQRDLLDRLVAELRPKLRERGAIRKKLKANRADVSKAMQEVRSAFERSDSEIRRFKEYKADFDKLNTPEVKGLFAALDLAQDKRRLLAQVKTNAEAQIGELSARQTR
jgi:energy-coupling factor transporter ATP-binding protein EcfA2